MRRSLILLLSALLVFGGLGLAAKSLIGSGAIAANLASDDDDDDCDKSGPGGDCKTPGAEHRDHDDDEDRDDDTTPPVQTGGQAGALEVHMAGETFSPGVLTIEVGQTVTFINDDDDEHTATGSSFDTGELNPGDTATVTFDSPGSFRFVCRFHADMQAEIVVQDPAGATPAATPEASPEAGTPVAGSARVEVSIADFQFDQASLTVAPGTTVVWTNDGAAPHTATGDFGDSGILDPGQTFEFTFTDPGTFAYFCAIHPDMQGEISVDPNAPAPSGG
ncbi:MAG: cupredoxin domain-containing protein [Chloroflexota bacterium]|nr:cupredoxin domain-containing protein [Chloroflexota bacterium]